LTGPDLSILMVINLAAAAVIVLKKLCKNVVFWTIIEIKKKAPCPWKTQGAFFFQLCPEKFHFSGRERPRL
jgi:hypothetical protein